MFNFLFNGFRTMCTCNLQKRLIRATFWVLLQAMFMNDWKQTVTQWLKLQERLLTINKRNIIRWNIYRDKNFHSRIQVFKCLKKSWVFKLKAYVYGCVFLGESKGGFLISDHMDSSLPKKYKIQKGSFTMTTACPRAPCGKKTTRWSSRRRQEEK